MKRQAWLTDALRRHERPLVRYASRLLGDVELARDVVQDCFLRLCQQPPQEVDGHVKEWLFTVCRNRAFDHLRKDGRMGALNDAEPAVEMPDPVAERDEKSRVLRQVAKLPARQQEVVRLKFQEGMSYREIAAVTSESISNVGYLLHTALKTLRGRLGDVAAPSERSRS